jgi:predicted RNA methylase
MSLLESRINTESWFSSDVEFNKIYPPKIQALARRHWTPLDVARKAAKFLATNNNSRILDIGSGVGKFCLSAAYYEPKAFFYGVEQRRNLVNYAEQAKEILALKNVSFINGNFTQLDFTKYDHFYFYNAFYENLAGTDKIDDSIDYSGELFNYYNRFLFTQLEKKPTGTKLVTFHSLEDEVPSSYHAIDLETDSLLKFWIKI